MQVESPFVFRATDPDPEFVTAIAKLKTAPNRKLNVLLDPTVLAPPKPAPVAAAALPLTPDAPKPKKNIFRKFGSLFARIFK
jgi:hypothetical protein